MSFVYVLKIAPRLRILLPDYGFKNKNKNIQSRRLNDEYLIHLDNFSRKVAYATLGMFP